MLELDVVLENSDSVELMEFMLTVRISLAIEPVYIRIFEKVPSNNIFPPQAVFVAILSIEKISCLTSKSIVAL